MSNELRNTNQQIVVNKYLAADPLQTTLVLSTGFGKSKVTIDILKMKMPVKVLILVNSTELRDFSWKDEFTKFDMEDFFIQRVELYTYQAAYKWKPKNVDLSEVFIVADEADFAADVPAFSKFFYNYHDCKILALTGFITGSKLEWFHKHLPILVRYSSEQAQADSVLNKMEFIFVKYDLSRNPQDIKIDYKKAGVAKHFHQSENNAYIYAQKQFQIMVGRKAKLENDFKIGIVDFEEYEVNSKRLNYSIKRFSSDRSNVLLNSIASADMAKKLLSFILADDNNKALVFSKRTSQSLKICGPDRTYNGTTSAKELRIRMDQFNSGLIRVLGVCDKVNRGANINRLNVAILETFYGSDTKAAQRFGRLMRLMPDEIATVYVLLPFYLKPDKDGVFQSKETQQCSWARNMLRSTNVKLSKVWDYRTVKT